MASRTSEGIQELFKYMSRLDNAQKTGTPGLDSPNYEAVIGVVRQEILNHKGGAEFLASVEKPAENFQTSEKLMKEIENLSLYIGFLGRCVRQSIHRVTLQDGTPLIC